jgi:hypothetical protein
MAAPLPANCCTAFAGIDGSGEVVASLRDSGAIVTGSAAADNASWREELCSSGLSRAMQPGHHRKGFRAP